MQKTKKTANSKISRGSLKDLVLNACCLTGQLRAQNTTRELQTLEHLQTSFGGGSRNLALNFVFALGLQQLLPTRPR